MNGWPILTSWPSCPAATDTDPRRARCALRRRALRLLPHIDWQGLVARQQRDPLLICASDFTAIQSGLLPWATSCLQRAECSPGNFGAETLDPFTEHHFWQALRQPEFTEWPGEGPNCRVEGTLWGGNLAMLTSLIGTPWLPAIRDGILVVEDINEHPFRVERMLLQLLHSGVLAAQKAVIFGSFTGSAPNDYDAGYDLPQVFDYLRQQLSLPLISGLEFGHEQRTVTLPLGARARLVNQAAATTLTIGGHPVLTE